MNLSAEQLRDLHEGLEHRERFHGGEYPRQDDDWELSLALRWFCEWWRIRADNAAIRKGRQQRTNEELDL